jgi:hypothetical protein
LSHRVFFFTGEPGNTRIFDVDKETMLKHDWDTAIGHLWDGCGRGGGWGGGGGGGATLGGGGGEYGGGGGGGG